MGFIQAAISHLKQCNRIKIFNYKELLDNSGSNRQPIGNIGKNSSGGKKFEGNASYRVLTPTNTSCLDWVTEVKDSGRIRFVKLKFPGQRT